PSDTGHTGTPVTAAITLAGSVDHPPVMSTDIVNTTRPEGATVGLDADATDQDGDPIVYSATGLPGGITIDPSSGVISGQLSFTSAGSYPVVVSATANGQAATDSFTLTVTNTDRPPVLSTDITNQTAAEGDSVDLDADATDADGD